jgi:thioesterase domain-containing protein/non-ribosomal peptide synthetase component F
MFSVTLAGCMVLLQRYTGIQDIALGSAHAGRDRGEIEAVVGLFVNQFLLRETVSGSDSFASLAARVRDRVWETVAHQETPFELIIKTLRPGSRPEDVSRERPWRDPLFTVNFNCYRAYGGTANLMPAFGGLQLTPIPSVSQGALYDLNFFLIERDGRWRVSLEYNSDLYCAETAERLVAAFGALLDQVAREPDRCIADIVLDLPKPVAEAATHIDNAAAQELADDGESAGMAVACQPANEVFALTASLAQQRFWLLTKVNPDGTAFNMPSTVRLQGALSLSHLQQSFDLLIHRHEILRTTFREVDGDLLQIIAPAMLFPLAVSDIGAVSADEGDAEVQTILREEAERPFDLEQGPLIRARLIRLNDADHVLIIVLHHILSDGWSSNIVQREIWSAYEAFVQGQQPALPALDIQYADFAVWQRHWLESEEAREQFEFWMQRLGGTLPVLDMPTDRPPSGRPAKHGAVESVALPASLVADLKAFGKAENATLYMVLLAAFSVLLSRYSNQDDVIIGSPVAKRRPETEALIGPFAGPIALRFDMTGDLTLRQVIRQSVDISMDAMANADMSFEWLFEKLKVRTRRGRNPLFQFYFFYQLAFLQARTLRNLTVTPMQAIGVGTPFELQLAVIERDGQLKANLEYNPELFDGTTIRSILADFELVLQATAATPDLSMRALTLNAPRSSHRNTFEPPAEHRVVLPRNADEAMVALIWRKILEVPAVSVTDDFFEIGGTSILAARLVLMLEKEMGVRLDLSSILVAPTVEQLTQKICAGRQNEPSQIVPLRPSGSKVPLFCVHGGGGHVLHYRELTTLLDADQPVYGLQTPDIDGAQRTTTVEQLAELYVSDIRRVQKHGPYQLCGLSFGGLVAYEMACQLAAAGEEVGLVALFDTGNPAYYRTLSPERSAEFRTTYLRDRILKYARNLMWGRLGAALRDVRQLIGSRSSVAAWMTVRRLFQAIGQPIPRIVRSNFIMFLLIGRSYAPKPYPGTIHLFRAEGRTAEYLADAALGWEQMAGQGVVVHHVAGGHVTMMERPNVVPLVEQLRALLVGDVNDATSVSRRESRQKTTSAVSG